MPRFLSLLFSALGLLLPLSLLCLALGGCGHPSLDLKVPKEQVVSLIAKQFPMARKVGTLTVTLSAPETDFDGARDRIELRCALDFAMEALPPGNGEVRIEGKMGVENGSVILTEVQVEEVTLDNVAGDNAEVMKRFISQSLLQALDGMTVYDLGKNGAAQYVAGITVTEDGLDVRLEQAP